jgi:mono/diheme cytochrome c family protein
VLSFAPLVAAPTTGHEIILACVGGAFIVFALISSFVLPRRNPNFPGRGVWSFVALGALFLVAMLAAVILFGKEATTDAAGERVTTTPAPQTTTQPPATTSAGGQNGAPPQAAGDPVAGKKVFSDAGCSGCHTLKAAGSTGNIGPNLDQLEPDYATVEHQVINGGGAMPAFKGQLSQKQIQDVSAFVSQNAGK